MAAKHPEFLTFLLAELGHLDELTTQRFFGGWQLRSAGTQFAVVLGGILYFRVDDALRTALEGEGSRPFSYAKSGKEVIVGKYMSAPDGALDDLDALRAWVDRVIAAI